MTVFINIEGKLAILTIRGSLCSYDGTQTLVKLYFFSQILYYLVVMTIKWVYLVNLETRWLPSSVLRLLSEGGGHSLHMTSLPNVASRDP